MNNSRDGRILYDIAFQDLLWGSAYLGIVLLCGYTAAALFLKPQRRSSPELLGLSFAGGCAILSFGLFFSSIAGIKPGRFVLIGLGPVALMCLWILHRRRRLWIPVFPTRSHRIDALAILGLLGLGLIFSGILIASTRASHPVLEEVDATAIWMFKAKWVAVKPLVPMPPEFNDPTLSYSHQDYPLGFPFLVAGLFAMVGRVDDRLVRIILLPTYLALIATVYSTVRRHHRRAIAMVLTGLFAAAPAMTIIGGSPISESLLILTYAAALSQMLDWISTGERGALIFSGLLMAGCAFSKNEGLALLPVVGLAALIWAITRRNQRQIVDWMCCAIVASLAIAPWLIYRRYLPRTHEDYGTKLQNLSGIIHNLSRLHYVLPEFAGWMFDGSRVGLLWDVLASLVLICPRALRRGPAIVLWSILLIQLGLYLLTFVVTPWDVHELVPMISARLLTQASPVVIFLISLHLRELNWTPIQPAPIILPQT